MNIKKILIVGGGSAGWMVAAAMIKQLPGIKISVIESPNIPIIGVGESTFLAFNLFLDAVGLLNKDEEWMPGCNAVYKTSIRLTDFRKKLDLPEHFHFPFGKMNMSNKKGIMDWFCSKVINPDLPVNTFAEYFHDNVSMINSNKLTNNENDELVGFDFTHETAYHFDAGLFGQWLKNNICLPNGVELIADNIKDASLDSNGNIDKIITSLGLELEADLFVDCTGFKSLLLEQKLGVKFIPDSDLLVNDSALFGPLPYIDKEVELQSFTNCTALGNGWAWNTPVWNRIGTGYCYSSKFCTREQAELEFREYLSSNRMVIPDKTRAEEMKFNHLTMKIGSHEKTWEKNVVAIGLSSGFFEPLESSGQVQLTMLLLQVVDLIKMRNGSINKIDVDIVNNNFAKRMKFYKEFIAMHYALSVRDDTEYWKHVTQNIDYSKMELFQKFSDNMFYGQFDNSMGGMMYVAAGMGYYPNNTSIVNAFNMSNSYKNYQITRKLQDDKLNNKLSIMLSTYEFLKKYIYKK
jgi:tryptophan halogenase